MLAINQINFTYPVVDDSSQQLTQNEFLQHVEPIGYYAKYTAGSRDIRLIYSF